MAKQRLILLFDGTWNDPEDQTNVYRLARRICDYDGDIRQRFYYDPGVGSSTRKRFLGGLFGYGLSQNLLNGYAWLAKHYTEGDEIWLFGFSRGAYTARSLVGLIRKCGLLHIVTPNLLDKAEGIYRNKKQAPDSDECLAFRSRYSRTPRVYFIGVWDTVGALGVPGTFLSEKGKYAWHDTELSSIVDYAYHAMALDEHRAVFDVTLWTSIDGKQKGRNCEVQQCWFVGAHANVGGGYGDDDLLADIPLQWMLHKAQKAGLKCESLASSEHAWTLQPQDSFNAFLYGLYARYRRLTRCDDGQFYRPFNKGNNQLPSVNVSVHDSVWKRWASPYLHYRPRTLTDAGQHPPNKSKS